MKEIRIRQTNAGLDEKNNALHHKDTQRQTNAALNRKKWQLAS